MNYYGGGYGYMMPFDFGFGIFGSIMMILVWALIIWGIVVFVRSNNYSSGRMSHHRGSALDIAKARFARGEITKDEYEEIKKELMK